MALRKLKMQLRKRCVEMVWDEGKQRLRRCRKWVTVGRTFCSTHPKGSNSSTNPAELTPSAPHISAESIQSAMLIDFPGATTDISNAALASTLPKASQVASTYRTTHLPTPQKAIQQSATDSNLIIRRDVFRNNLKELILVK